MRWGALWMLMPDAAMPLVVLGVGLAVLFGFLRGRAALALLFGLLVLPILLAPFVETAMAELPAWISLAVLLLLLLAILRGVAALLIGRAAAAEMVGHIAAQAVIALFALPFRMVRWGFRLLTNRNGLP